VKFLASELLAILSQDQMQKNVRALSRYLVVLGLLIAIYTVLFHVLMLYEGRDYSWITAVYWTLTVMTTLGFGDITFQSDLGRGFTIVVLLSGVVLLLIVLPYAFIRHFYAPWLEAQVRVKAPRKLDDEVSGHVIFGRIDDVATAVIARLELMGIPYVALEPDPARAIAATDSGYSIVLGERDARTTYEAVRVKNARLLVANLDDRTNTNLTLTAREECTQTPIVAFADDKDAVDILLLSGASKVLALKHRLGEYLAARVSLGDVHAEVVASYRDLLIAEVPIHGTPFVGKTIAETSFRAVTGLWIVAHWERGRLLTARPDAVLTDHSVAMIAGTQAQIDGLNEALLQASLPPEPARVLGDQPVVVIGGGKVGRAAARALRKRGLTVHIVDANPELRPILSELASRVIIGNAADLNVITEAGIARAPSVLLSTHDDATNIYLAVYCRKLNPDCRIISRIVSDRNLESMHRAGADFVLGESALGAKFVMSVLHQREVIVLGEDVDAFIVPVPRSLAGRTIAESGIGPRTGLSVIAIQTASELIKVPEPTAVIPAGAELVMLGTQAQRREFVVLYVEDEKRA
jgi:Trk K+ transport system NAD-binding subunit